MKKNKLTLRETIVVASTLFGMFFGAGNLIFPVHLGQMAGSNSWPAIIGFCITAVKGTILGTEHDDRSPVQAKDLIQFQRNRQINGTFVCSRKRNRSPVFPAVSGVNHQHRTLITLRSEYRLFRGRHGFP